MVLLKAAGSFWLYWRTMFAFENWHSALEMKLYLKRFIHHVGGLPDFTALRFTRYNQYESMILPMVHYLQEHGVDFQYNTKVVNVEFDIRNGRKAARRIVLQREGRKDAIDLTDRPNFLSVWASCPCFSVARQSE